MPYDLAVSVGTLKAQTILIVSPEGSERSQLVHAFTENGFGVVEAASPEDAATQINDVSVGLVILDERSCVAEVYEFCRSATVAGGAPVIVMARTTDTVSRIVALEVGADAVVGADIDPRLLVAQARAVLRRRASSTVPSQYGHGTGRWRLDPQTHIATGPNGRTVELARHQARLMTHFLNRPGIVVTVDSLAQEAPALRMEPAAFRTAISRLRRRLDPLALEPFVRVVRGCGYLHAPTAADSEVADGAHG